ncbi:MAG: hypothetical protein JRF08_07935 [Deltaproteobacteria bacterium]|nr:hypothetical protein [Deltaproteobacteria bacterium]
MITKYKQIEIMAHSEFSDIVATSQIVHKRTAGSAKLRLFFKDQTYMDIWLSESGKFSYHWEHRAKRGLIHRHDNAPDHPEISTFPKHFHNGDEKSVRPSHLNDEPLNAIREFLEFVKTFIANH